MPSSSAPELPPCVKAMIEDSVGIFKEKAGGAITFVEALGYVKLYRDEITRVALGAYTEGLNRSSSVGALRDVRS